MRTGVARLVARQALILLSTAVIVFVAVVAAGSATGHTTVLWVFAHPDDETIAGGGALQRQSDLGHQTVLILTDGEGSVVGRHLGMSRRDVARARRLEARAALARVGIDDIRFAGLPDGALTAEAVEQAVRGLISELGGPVLLRGHSPADNYHPYGACGHPDHCAAGTALAAIAAGGRVLDVQLYRVGHLFGGPRAGVCRTLTEEELTGKQTMRDEYGLRDPVAGRRGVGGLSVPRQWQATQAAQECFDAPGLDDRADTVARAGTWERE